MTAGRKVTESGVFSPIDETMGVLLGSAKAEPTRQADVAELADAIDLGSIARQGVEVRVLSSAPVVSGQEVRRTGSPAQGKYGPVAKREGACFASRRSSVRIRPGPLVVNAGCCLAMMSEKQQAKNLQISDG